jgi:hypothetical protein
MRAVNLLPRDDARRNVKLTPPVATAIVAGVLVVTVLCAGFLLSSAKVTDKRNELEAARAELALVPPPAPIPPGAQQNLSGEQTARVASLQGAINGRVAWDRILRELALVLPGDVWLSHLLVTTPSATPTAPGPATQFDISGTAFSHDGVARFLSRLQVIPDLTNVSLDHSRTLSPGSLHKPVEFKIMAGIRPAGATS